MLGFPPKHAKQLLHDAYRKQESIKKQEYTQHAHEVEHGVFTPLVLSATGGMGREAATFYKRLADRISTKEQKPYSVVMGWICCRLSFAIIRLAILCIHGSTFSHHRPTHELNITLAHQREVFPLMCSESFRLKVYFYHHSSFLPVFFFLSTLPFEVISNPVSSHIFIACT